MSEHVPEPGCLSVVPFVVVGALTGLCVGLPCFYGLLFGGDVGTLVEVARFRVFGHPSRCDPDAPPSVASSTGRWDQPPPHACLPFAARDLDAGTELKGEDVVFRLLPPAYVPDQALRDVPPGATTASRILKGELLRRERLR